MRTLVMLVLCLSAPGSAILAQGKFPPDSFTNLKVLPKNIDQRTLISTMRGFALALGVRCTYCHVGPEGAPLDSLNFASDDKRTKRTARVMLDMVSHINEEHLADVPDRPVPHVVVRCATCHRGLARPRLLDDELALMLADSGLAALVQRYRALRERYYGSGAYDFGEIVLNDLARVEQRAGRTDNAIGLLSLNAEFNPRSAFIPAALGEAYLQKGDTARAIASYRAALAKDSTQGLAHTRINELTGRHLRRPSSPLLSVAGTYATAVTLVADSCTGTMIRDNPTLVEQQPGDTIVRLTHAAIAASGSVHNDGRFQMAPAVMRISGVSYHVDINGRFEERGFAATVHVAAGDLGQPTRCGYTVRWIGNKRGAPNVIPEAQR